MSSGHFIYIHMWSNKIFFFHVSMSKYACVIRYSWTIQPEVSLTDSLVSSSSSSSSAYLNSDSTIAVAHYYYCIRQYVHIRILSSESARVQALFKSKIMINLCKEHLGERRAARRCN